ncbi:LD-carboxypeptidase LdcB/DacB [Streptococcus sp. H49]|uniref:LD-carboxypeptidase LdcB/DacB n=1 Tax=Streptococcus huangxiaojuni TaxID=3237239 RepID=UPI0034A38694
MKGNFLIRERQRFSIRKYTFGAVSVLLGCVLFFGGQRVLAEEQNSVCPQETVAEEVKESAEGAIADVYLGTAEDNQLQTVEIGSSEVSISEQQQTYDTDTGQSVGDGTTADVVLSEMLIQTETAVTDSFELSAESEKPETADNSLQLVSSLEETVDPVQTRTVFNVNDFLAESNFISPVSLSESKMVASGSLPNQGNYVYTKRTEVKNEPKLSARTEFYVNAGDKVFYDQLITADGYQWISYLSYSGVRRYAAISEQTSVQVPKIQSLASQGLYTFTKEVTVKSEPKQSAPVQFVFNKGETINYDSVLDSDGHQWLSYISYSGIRRYVDIGQSIKSTIKPQITENKVTGQLIIQNKTSEGFEVLVTNVSDNNGIVSVKVPVWTVNAGQDDIIWYNASKQNNGDYRVAVKISNHKNEHGTYNVHLYYVENNGKTVGVASTHTNVAAVSTVASAIPSRGSYRFTKNVDVKNQPRLSAKTEFTFTKGEAINYDRVLTEDNYQWLSYVSYSGIRRYIPIIENTTDDKKIINSQTQVTRTGNIAIHNQTSDGFDVIIDNIFDSKGIQSVKVPVWSVRNGQDDLIWYDAVRHNNNYKVTVKRSNHKNDYGDYYINLYYVENDNQLAGIVSAKTTLSEPQVVRTGNLSIQNQSSDRFDVIVSNVSDSRGIREVKIPVWTDKNGQDDLIWYNGHRQNDGNYKITVNRSSHKNEYGDYHVHLYYIENDGQTVGITSTEVTLSEPKTSGTIAIEDKSSQGFTVVIQNVSSPVGIQAVKVPVWSTQGGQDDLIWYDAVNQGGGTYKAIVRTSAHQNSYGEYNIHLYYVQRDGTMMGIVATKTIVEAPKTNEKREVTYNGSYYSIQGKYDQILVVNKNYPLSPTYNPGENGTAKAAFVRMRDDMIKQGYNVGYGYSGFRSYSTQAELYQSYVNRDGQTAADRYSARPGYSEHQTGLAYDLTDKSGALLEDKAASDWLRKNAHKYGFVVRYQSGKEAITGFMEEPWHVRYIGKEAQEIYESGLSLEEYYGFKGGNYSYAQTLNNNSLPSQGSYTFTKRSSVKAEAKVSSPELAYYDKGNTVNYDKVLFSDGCQWISYIAFSGVRRYIAI